MRRILLAVALVTATAVTPALAQDSAGRKQSKEADLKKQSSVAPDQSLAGDLTRKKESGPTGPSLQYDQFRLGVELQVASKRHEQIESLKKIIAFSPAGSNDKEMPTLLFRLGELYWEESKYFFFEANRKDDELGAAGEDQAARARINEEKNALLAKSKDFGKLAVDQYSTIVQNYKDYERTDEVLYFLGKNLMEANEDRKALVAYKRLIDKFPRSKYVPDAHLAYGEYYFNNSQGRREQLEKALDAYKKAASFPESQVYGFALYKQGWCYFNMSEYQRSMDMFKSVVLYGELSASADKEGASKGKSSLAREARMDFVRAYARVGTPNDARDVFSKVASKPEDRFAMMRQLANIYYDDGKDKEAALTFNALIRERPLSPESPLFQGKIVDCVLRAGNKRMTVEQVRRLVKLMQDVEKAGTAKDEKDKKSIVAARELSERTLSNIAVNWHNEAKKTRDEEVFSLANEIYADYLALFPENPKAYDLRFFWAELLYDNLRRYDKAAEEYTKVVMIDAKRLEQAAAQKKEAPKEPQGKSAKAAKPIKAGKWLEKAAYNAVLAYDEVVKDAISKGTLKTEVKGSEKVNLPPPEQALVDACERYVKYVPNGEKTVEITFKAANIYYRRNHFDEAVSRFTKIALEHPEYKFENGAKAGELAANLVLSAYEDLKDWGKLNEAARKFYANDKLAQGPFRDELSKVLEKSSFQLVKQLEQKQEYVQAAEAYLQFVTEFPSSDIADKALFNASVDFFKGKQLDRSIEMRQRLIEKYPKSPFVPDAMFANAEGLEAVGDFDAAADAYEVYARGYEKSLGVKPGAPVRGKKRRGKAAEAAPVAAKDKDGKPLPGWEESKAQIALLNAGVYREGLGQLKGALKNREHFLELWPNSKDAEAVNLSIADLYEKMGQQGRQLAHLEQYEKDNVRDPNKVLMAEGRIARSYEQRRRPRDVARIYKRITDYYNKLGPKGRKALDDTALEAVARAHNLEAEADYQRYTGVRLRWGRMPSPEKDFKASMAEKLRSLDVVKKSFTQTVAFKQGDPAVCALFKIGASYDHMVEALLNVPMPRAFPPEVQDALREEFGKTAQPLKAQATEAFSSAVQKSRELNLRNDCADKALKLLREKYQPEQFPPVLEETAELKVAKLATTGEGLLTGVQPVPNTFKRDAGRAQEHQDLGQRVKSQVDAESRSDQKPATSSERRSSKPDSEPEDSL